MFLGFSLNPVKPTSFMSEQVTQGNAQVSSETKHVLPTLSAHGLIIARHDNILVSLKSQQQASNQQLEQLASKMICLEQKLTALQPPAQAAVAFQLTASTSENPAVPSNTFPVSPPEYFEGDFDLCGGFLLQCSLNFNRNPQTFPSDCIKIAFIASFLKGKALRWADAYLSSHPIEHLPLDSFLSDFCGVFDHPLSEEDAGRRLLTVHQGRRPVVDHSRDFRILALRTRWNNVALKACFVNSLSEKLKDQIATSDEPETLNDLIDLAIRIDYRLRDRNRERNSLRLTRTSTSFSKPAVQPYSSPSPKNTKVGPLRVIRTRLSQKERRRRINLKLCVYCGEPDHLIAVCPRRSNSRSHR